MHNTFSNKSLYSENISKSFETVGFLESDKMEKLHWAIVLSFSHSFSFRFQSIVDAL